VVTYLTFVPDCRRSAADIIIIIIIIIIIVIVTANKLEYLKQEI